jgi:hypothetical protein
MPVNRCSARARISAQPSTKRGQNVVEATRRTLRDQLDGWFSKHEDLLGSTVRSLHNKDDGLLWPERTEETDPEEELCHLPSQYPAEAFSNPLLAFYKHVELDLRCAMANELLAELQLKIGLWSFLWRETKSSVGQARTRTQKPVSDARDAIDKIRNDYNNLQRVITTMGDPAIVAKYRPLLATDCKAIPLWHAKDVPGRKKETPSWIWEDTRISESQAGAEDWEIEGQLTDLRHST